MGFNYEQFHTLPWSFLNNLHWQSPMCSRAGHEIFSSRNKTVYLSKAYPFVRFDCVIFSTITNSLVFFWKTLPTLNLWLFWFLFCYFYTATCWWQFGCEYFASHGTCCSRKLYIKKYLDMTTPREKLLPSCFKCQLCQIL